MKRIDGIGEWILDHDEGVRAAVVVVGATYLAVTYAMLWVSQSVFVAMASPALTFTFGVLVSRFLPALIHWRNHKYAGFAPKNIQHIGNDGEGNHTVSVLLHNGEVRLVQVPDDYHPSQDDAELVLRRAIPELFGPGGPLEDQL